MTITRAIKLIKIIETLAILKARTTRHSIAKSFVQVSRSTTYRCLNRMIELDILYIDGDGQLYGTELSEKIVESQGELF